MKIVLKAFCMIMILSTLAKAQLLPLPPTPLSPLNNAVNVSLTPTLKWNIVLGLNTLSSFRLQVSTNQNFNTLVLDSAGITADSIRIPQGILSSNTRYYWRVNAAVIVNFILLTTPYSVAFNFTTGTFTGIHPVNSELPSKYKLYDNYPNPFNPATKIKFDNIVSQNVNLIVYDIHGKIVEELVNESLGSGSYEIGWNAAGYSSGVYFYRLVAGNFTDTKKMILSK